MDNAPTERKQTISSAPEQDSGEVFERVVHKVPDGSYRWARELASLERDCNGHVTRGDRHHRGKTARGGP